VAGKTKPAVWRAAHRLTALVIVAAALAAAGLVGLAWVAGVGEVLSRLVHPHWLWLGVAVAGEVVAYAGYTAAYREVARAEDGTELGTPRAAALVATGFGVFVHGGGFALDRAALQHAGLSETEARRRVLGLSFLEYAVLAPAALVAAVFVLFFHNSISASLTVPWIVGVPVGAVLALTALRYRTRVRRWPYIGRPLDRGLHALALVLGLLRSPRNHGLALVGTIAYWGGDIFCLWATLHAFTTHTPPVAQLVVGYATGYALTRRALPLGGAGIVEVLLPFSLEWLGIPLAPALVAVFAYRLINLWLPIVPALAGLPSLRSLERARSGRRARTRGSGAPGTGAAGRRAGAAGADR
jgi:uncharacterized membrane protein YbhN (UPF0104 family)